MKLAHAVKIAPFILRRQFAVCAGVVDVAAASDVEVVGRAAVVDEVSAAFLVLEIVVPSLLQPMRIDTEASSAIGVSRRMIGS